MSGRNQVPYVKCGWLNRKVENGWNKRWFVLNQFGALLYFHDQNQPAPEGVVMISGGHCSSIEDFNIPPPEGMSKNAIMRLKMQDANAPVILCAESDDDKEAWKYALNQARCQQGPTLPGPVPTTAVTADGRQVPVSVMPDPSGQFYPTYFTDSYGRQAMVLPPGAQVLYVDGYPSRCMGSNVALAGLTGAMMGAWLFSPFLFFPFFW